MPLQNNVKSHAGTESLDGETQALSKCNEEWSGVHLQQLYVLTQYMKLSRNCVISKDLADFAMRSMMKENSNCIDSLSPSGKKTINTLDYCYL